MFGAIPRIKNNDGLAWLGFPAAETELQQVSQKEVLLMPVLGHVLSGMDEGKWHSFTFLTCVVFFH